MADPREPRSTDTVRDPVRGPASAPGLDPIAPTGAPITGRGGRGGGAGKWLWIALAVLVVLLLLWWFFDFFGGAGEIVTGTTAGDVEAVASAQAD